MKMTRKKVWSAVITLLSIALGVIWLAPLIWLVGTALTETTFHMTFLPTTPFTLDNIKYVWNAVPFGQYYLNTIILVVGTFCIQFVTSTLAAYSLAFYRFKGQGLVFLIIFMQIIIPNDVLIIPNFMTLSELGLYDTKLGVMLPCTPVQHLLLHDFTQTLQAQRGADALGMLVMTSGNLHNEPIVTDDAQARQKLAGIADAVLGNNRAILSRYDDSVVRVIQAGGEQAIQFVRRARGYAPLPLPLGCPEAQPKQETLLAVGPEQKATFALVRAAAADDQQPDAFVSQHIGDVENAETYDAWLEAKSRYESLFQERPARLACDKHPEYLTSKWAREQAQRDKLPLVEVQHHHAHVASVLGENNLFGPVCGIAFDGTGYGADGNIWGGEVLLANQQTYERFANFAYVPMPGGAAAVRNPLRMAYGVLHEFDLLEHAGAADVLEALGEQADVCAQMIERGLNTPYTSSVGRLFDAASAILGICPQPTYEGQPAIELEAAMGFAPAELPITDAYHIDVVKNTATETSTALDTSVLLFDAAPAFAALLDDKAAGVPVPVMARRFHDAFVRAAVMAAQLVESLYGITTVALSGGVFLNRYLIEHVAEALQNAGFTVALNRDLPPSDGCISYGQAVVAWAANKTSELAGE